MKIKDIKFGDIVTYRSGRINNVNNPSKYYQYFNNNFETFSFPRYLLLPSIIFLLLIATLFGH